ncbi:hypothetical protein, partial [Burkholderia cenocepacia]|uniref:hypothetical protein n=1 Tax=Burkholderia cenocepacia TaxID=95486 RepID=UPI001C8A2121
EARAHECAQQPLTRHVTAIVKSKQSNNERHNKFDNDNENEKTKKRNKKKTKNGYTQRSE